MTVLDEGLRRLYDGIAGTGLPFFVGGSVAAMSYGEPRATLDIDVVVDAAPGDAKRIAAAFDPGKFYVPHAETIRVELGRRGGQFNVIDLASGLKADIYVARDDPLIAFGLANASERPIGPLRMRVAPATYVVAMKLRFYGISRQDKHLRDIRSILALSPAEVDHAEVARWAASAGVSNAWAECQRRPGAEGP